MKRILFLSFAYPYGHFGPSDNCTVRIMDALVQAGKYEVFNISCAPSRANSKPNYKLIEGVNNIYLPFPEKFAHHSYFIEHLLLALKIPFYPLYDIHRIWKYYKACEAILKKEQFDLVVAQCAPQESVISAVLLKKYGYINKLMVLFWDNIYGKVPRLVIPKWFAIYRSRRVETWIARYANSLISPTPVKSFHELYGEVPTAKDKRVYLEHPSIMKRKFPVSSIIGTFLREDKMNVIYAGRIYFKEQLVYCVDMLNKTSIAEKINLILLTKGISGTDAEHLSNTFKGSMIISDWLPLDDLYALYARVDFCIAIPGYPTSVSSKIYEYMSFGKPILLFYTYDNDVTKLACQRYPYFNAINFRKNTDETSRQAEFFFTQHYGKTVPYEDVERLYPTATASAYVNCISKIIDKQ